MGRGKYKNKPTGHRQFSTREDLRKPSFLILPFTIVCFIPTEPAWFMFIIFSWTQNTNNAFSSSNGVLLFGFELEPSEFLLIMKDLNLISHCMLCVKILAVSDVNCKLKYSSTSQIIYIFMYLLNNPENNYSFILNFSTWFHVIETYGRYSGISLFVFIALGILTRCRWDFNESYKWVLLHKMNSLWVLFDFGMFKF